MVAGCLDGMDPMRPFTTAQAQTAGISRAQLRNRHRFRRLFTGVYVHAAVRPDLRAWLAGALLLAPADSLVSHTSAMRLYGFDTSVRRDLELTTSADARKRIPHVTVHRTRHIDRGREVRGLMVTSPERTFVDVAGRLSLPQLVAFGDHLVHRGLSTPEDLVWFALSTHHHGVRRARRISRLIRAGAESPQESRVRLMMRL